MLVDFVLSSDNSFDISSNLIQTDLWERGDMRFIQHKKSTFILRNMIDAIGIVLFVEERDKSRR